MPTKNFGSTFKSAVNRGTPASQVVVNIARKARKTETEVWNSLFQDGYVNRKKVGGNFIYYPTFQPPRKPRTGNFKTYGFQQFINWAIVSGYCTPEQVEQLKSQNDFFNFFGPFFAGEFGWTINSGWTKTEVNRFGSHTNNRSRTRKGAKSGTKRRAKSGRRTSGKKRTGASKGRKRRTSVRSRKSGTTRRRRKSTTARGRRTGVGSYRFPKSGSRAYRFAA